MPPDALPHDPTRPAVFDDRSRAANGAIPLPGDFLRAALPCLELFTCYNIRSERFQMSRRTTQLAILVIAGLGFATGCGLIDSPNKCNAIHSYTLLVTVTDASTGAPAGAGATVIVRAEDGSSADSSSRAAGGSNDDTFNFFGAAGLWDVIVRKPGYADAVRTGIEVQASKSKDCPGPVLTHVAVALTPLSP